MLNTFLHIYMKNAVNSLFEGCHISSYSVVCFPLFGSYLFFLTLSIFVAVFLLGICLVDSIYLILFQLSLMQCHGFIADSTQNYLRYSYLI